MGKGESMGSFGKGKQGYPDLVALFYLISCLFKVFVVAFFCSVLE